MGSVLKRRLNHSRDMWEQLCKLTSFHGHMHGERHYCNVPSDEITGPSAAGA